MFVIVATQARAHDARPLSVAMVEQSPAVYRVVVRAPPTLAVPNAPTLIWPERCEIRESAPLSLSLGSTSLVECAGGLAGSTLELRYPDYNPSLTTLMRLETVEGQSLTAVLPPDELQWSVPESPNFGDIATQYAGLGVKHILEGIDHLLFVAGLLLLAKQPKKIVLAVTGFTFAHSITLALAVLDMVRLPVDLVETLIALSVVFLAAEVIRNDPRSVSQRYPIVLSVVFGLLHGFGFASALGEINLPPSEIATGLLFFNIGVELGQLLFIGLCALLWRSYAQWHRKTRVTAADWQGTVMLRAGSYLIGIPAAFWFVQRTVRVFGG